MAKKTAQQTPKNLINITNVTGDAEILLYGFVGQYDDIDWRPFQKAFRELALTNKTITLRINCMGGDTFRGLAIYDLIRNSKVTVIGINEGVAASMGAILLQACDVRKGTQNSRVMVHCVSGFVGGNAQEVENYAKLMKDEDKKLLKILKDRTGADEKTCLGWMAYGIDSWFGADDAVTAGLLDEVITGEKAVDVSDDEIENAMQNHALDRIWSHFENIYKPENSLNQNTMNKLKLALMALLAQSGFTNSLTEADAEEKFIDAVKNVIGTKDQKITELTNKNTELTNKNTELSNAANATKDAEIKAICDQAEADGKFTNAERPAHEAKLKADFDFHKTIISKMQGKVDINQALSGGKGTGAQNTENKGGEDRTKWGYDEWATKDSKGLENLEKSNPELFNKLVADKVKAVQSTGIMG